MNIARFYWISAFSAILLVMGCNPPDASQNNDLRADTANAQVDSIPYHSNDSIANPIDSFGHAAQDTPPKSMQDLAKERRERDRLRQNPNPNHRPPENVMPSLSHNQLIPGCKAFFASIRTGWSHDAKTGLYQMQGDSIKGLRGEFPRMGECFHGLPETDIQALFGKPSKVVGSEMLYYMDKSCIGKNGFKSAGCECLRVELAATKVAKAVSIVKNQP